MQASENSLSTKQQVRYGVHMVRSTSYVHGMLTLCAVLCTPYIQYSVRVLLGTEYSNVIIKQALVLLSRIKRGRY